MPTTSGTISSFIELQQAILDWCCSAKRTEVLGTGDGVTKSFSHNFVNPTCAKGQCRVRFKIAGVVYDAWDDGEGKFPHAKIVQGTSSITYATGVAIEFIDAIDDNYEMSLVYTDGGTEGRDWLPLLDQKTRNSSNEEVWPAENLRETILKNSGVSYKDFAAVGMRDWKYPAESYWSLNLNIYDNYNYLREESGLWLCNGDFHLLTSYDTTRNYWSQLPHVPVRDDTMKYWISSSKSRIQVLVRVNSTVYLWFWLGQGRRIASPSRYAMPNIAIGAAVGAENYASSTIGILRSFMAIAPNDEHTASLVFEPFANFVCPLTAKKTTNGKIPPDLIYVKNTPFAQDPQNLMLLDGIVWAINNELTTEDTITDGGKTYLAFQNAYRTAYTDYFAMLLE